MMYCSGDGPFNVVSFSLEHSFLKQLLIIFVRVSNRLASFMFHEPACLCKLFGVQLLQIDSPFIKSESDKIFLYLLLKYRGI